MMVRTGGGIGLEWAPRRREAFLSDARARTPQTPQGGGNPDDAALNEDVDLDLDTRRKVLDLHRALERQSHYDLLGADHATDAKALKRIYNQLVLTFHPDRYFRKRLGSYKPRMEAVFGRLTLAYETLADPKRRAEYDAYLEERRRSLSIEQLLEEALAEAKRAEEAIEREVRAQSPPAMPPAAAAPAAPAPSASRPAAPPAATTPAATTPAPNVDVHARRDALARRLLGGRSPTSSSTPPARPSIAPPPFPTVADAMEALKRRYEERVTHAKAAQARKYVASGEAALAAGDAVSAANAFRVALSLSPADQAVAHAARDAQAKADDVLAEAYARQAAYEEKNGQWVEAARSWVRVCKARPGDPGAHESAANALLKSGGDLHEAARLATHTCSLEPSVARHRVTLAGVYIAAGLTLNARRELETAAQLAPHDGTIQAMMKKVGK